MQVIHDTFTASIRDVLTSTALSEEELLDIEAVWHESEEISDLLRVATEAAETRVQYYTRT